MSLLAEQLKEELEERKRDIAGLAQEKSSSVGSV